MTWRKWCWIHKGCHIHLPPHAWNCPVNELRGPQDQKASTADRQLFLQRRHKLTVWCSSWRIAFFLFILDAEEYQPPIWKSYCEYLKSISSEVFSRPAFWTIFAVDLVHTNSRITALQTQMSLSLLRKDIGQRELKEPVPWPGPRRARCLWPA